MFEHIQMGKKNNTTQPIKDHSKYLKLSQHPKNKWAQSSTKTNEEKPQDHINWTEN